MRSNGPLPDLGGLTGPFSYVGNQTVARQPLEQARAHCVCLTAFVHPRLFASCWAHHAPTWRLYPPPFLGFLPLFRFSIPINWRQETGTLQPSVASLRQARVEGSVKADFPTKNAGVPRCPKNSAISYFRSAPGGHTHSVHRIDLGAM